jgi:sec-independent protein translocase protein TatB
MFDITAGEFLLIAVVILIAVGPKRVGEVVRQVGRWVGRLRAEAARFKTGIEQEIDAVSAPAEQAGAEIKDTGADLQQTAKGAQADLAESLRAVGDSVKELKKVLPSTRRRPTRRRWF